MIKKLLSTINKYKWWILAYFAALIIRVAIALPLIHDWDGFVFSESAKNLVHGITPYQTVQSNSPVIYPDSDIPMTEQWYGYPPLPLLMFTSTYSILYFLGIHITPILQNFAIKFPFILGDLICAFLMSIYLRKWSTHLANRATLLVLFNPLLIWVSSAWGMFDLWLINFILLFLLSIRAKSGIWAGIFLSLAPQIKLFPIFFLPATILFFFQTIKDGKNRISFIVSFIVTTLIVDIPFFLSSPQGFMNQNLLMHLARPAQGIGIVTIIDYFGYIYNFNTSLFVTIGSILTLVSILLFNLFAAGYIKGKESKLLTVIFVIYTSTLLFNKVVNEQYYVVLVGLLILLTHFPKTMDGIFSRRFLVILEEIATFSVLIAGVVLGFHFLTFLPSFISDEVLKASTNYLVFFLSRLIPQLPLYTYPNSPWTFYNMPVTIVYILLLPLIALSGYVVLRSAIESYKIKEDIINSLISFCSLLKPTLPKALIVLAVLIPAVLFVIPFSSYLKTTNALKLVDLVDANNKPTFPSNPRVGTFYNVWWNNPSHILTTADDAWGLTTLTPQDGYYTSKNSYFAKHIQQMKSVGIDFAVVSYHLYDRERYLTFGKYAEKLGLYYAPLIETEDALDKPEYHPDDPEKNRKFLEFKISDDSEKALATRIISSVIENYKSPAILRINNKPVIFIYDGHWFYPDFTLQAKTALAEIIVNKYKGQGSDPFKTISKAWNTPVTSLQDVISHYPKLVTDFDLNTSSAQAFKAAFIEEYKDYWIKVRNDVEAKVGPVYLLSTYDSPTPAHNSYVIKANDITSLRIFDNEFFYSLSNTWVQWKQVAMPTTTMKVWENQEKEQAERDRKNIWPAFLTVNPTYNDTSVRGNVGFEIPSKINGVSVYDWTWQQVAKNKADYVLIATWNEFFEGSAIEPTKEYGDYYLKATEQFIRRFKQGVLTQSQ